MMPHAMLQPIVAYNSSVVAPGLPEIRAGAQRERQRHDEPEQDLAEARTRRQVVGEECHRQFATREGGAMNDPIR